MKGFYLSFANESGFMGGSIVEAKSPVEAVEVANKLKLNPGGAEIAVIALKDGWKPSFYGKTYLNKFVPADEVRAQGATRFDSRAATAVVCEDCNPRRR